MLGPQIKARQRHAQRKHMPLLASTETKRDYTIFSSVALIFRWPMTNTGQYSVRIAPMYHLLRLLCNMDVLREFTRSEVQVGHREQPLLSIVKHLRVMSHE